VKSPIFHPEAETEYEEAIARYEAKRHGLGIEFQELVQTRVALIGKLPETFPRFEDLEIRKCVLDRFP
jgi:hypothetical protein